MNYGPIVLAGFMIQTAVDRKFKERGDKTVKILFFYHVLVLFILNI